MGYQITLPSKADSATAPALLAELQALYGKPCSIDASQCQSIGALCASILLVARRSWHQENCIFSIVGAHSLSTDLMLLGMTEILSEMESEK